MVSAEMLNCKLLTTQAAGIKHLYFSCSVMEITNGQPWQNSIHNSLFWRGAERHCQVAEILLHKYKRSIKSKFTPSNALLKSAEYSITRKENFSFLA